MALKAKHAHGSRKSLESAITNKVIDNFDVLFLSGEDENPAMGWLDKNGNPIILSPADEVAKLETQVKTKLAEKADAETVKTMEAEIANKVSAEEVNAKVKASVEDGIAVAKAYTDGKVEAAVKEHLVKKFVIEGVPEGTLIDYRDNEIRIMCRENSEFSKQSVGATGNPNYYYFTLKTYVFDENVVGYREHIGEQFDGETLTDLKVDKFDKRYQPTWLALAKYDEATDSWDYIGKDSNSEKMKGFDYRIDWYDANDVMIGSDSVRINLSNEECHFINEPYYVGKIRKEVDTKIEEKIAEVEAAYEIIEF